MSYTKEDVQKIIIGLATGRRTVRPMSDQEVERRYDPVATEHRELMGALKELTLAFQTLVEERQSAREPRERSSQPYIPKASTAPRGTTEL